MSIVMQYVFKLFLILHILTYIFMEIFISTRSENFTNVAL